MRMKEVVAQGGGFNAVYRFIKEKSRYDEGWALIEPGGTYLTPGIGKPMRYPTPEETLEAVRTRPGVSIVVRDRKEQ